ncbi:SGNH/GDSL hydrolase family protein [Hymenobacter sp. BT507]|uniref:SGNH/GDSL hydrolase family protein n=1 Tax=Hymenobacter citatus TaxID=2763506 RepID=A0ABR7MHG7_9BACT|nr:SGNH/GDSL hydrolase family protein [Hymenobacter citatus]MBC6610319.1 SGNH/GDSL hydrolase family protein [Hymenobacter citatus]
MYTITFRRVVPFLALLGLGLTACQPDLEDEVKTSAGTADFSRYIAVGNSLTAGFSDNGLYLEGQQNSYPAMLAQQFRAVGGGDFVQPLFTEAQANGSGYLYLAGIDANNNPQIANRAPGAVVGTGADTKTPLLAKPANAAANQNLGVPGIRVADVTTNGYGLNNPLGFNPYFERLLSNSPASYLQYVQERVATIKPTFFSNWLGNNDVLGYASSGGTSAPLTPDAEFTTKYNQVVDALTQNDAKGIVANIPSVTSTPLFTTISTAAVIAQVNATPIPAAQAPLIAQALGLPALPAGTRFALYVRTSSTTTPVRLATASDLILLPARSVINTPSATSPFPNGIGLEIPGAPAATAALLAAAANPLANALVLDAAEVTAVNNRTTALNNIIKASADRKGLAYFDANAFLTRVAAGGVVVNGVPNNAGFISGNLFSLDGVHLTPRGYAIVANEMIKAINAKYNASVPQLNPLDYRGVKFP